MSGSKHCIILFVISILLFSCYPKGKVTLVTSQATSRELFGVEKLAKALTDNGYQVVRTDKTIADTVSQIVVGTLSNQLLTTFVKSDAKLDTLK